MVLIREKAEEIIKDNHKPKKNLARERGRAREEDEEEEEGKGKKNQTIMTGSPQKGN